jgi:hypothetical protein
MTDERRYTAGTRAALFAFCGGTCYWPGCHEPVVRSVDGEYVIALQICHIYGLKPKSARYDPTMDDEERNAFENLIFLCHPHHVVVDRTQADRFPVDVLEEWKRQRESGQQATLRGLRNVTEAGLQNLIGDVFSQQNQRVENVLARLERSDAEAAAVMAELRDEIRMLRSSGPLVDLDAAHMLDSAARKLVGLEDKASLLNRATTGLRGLEDVAAHLDRVADRIDRLRGDM